MKHRVFRIVQNTAALVLGLTLAACGGGEHLSRTPLTAGARYVAMGSSFAAGPGVGAPADGVTRCGRSARNYAHQLAEALRLTLTDVSCSGATTAHVLGNWGELPAQIAAVTPDTALVTVTIGGNDVGYLGGLIGASCRFLGGPPPGSPYPQCPESKLASEAQWAELERSMQAIAAAVHQRAPAARLVFVDYLAVLPERGKCSATPMREEDAAQAREVARRLVLITAKVAKENGAALLKASILSQTHSACDQNPWTSGFPLTGASRFAPYHPNEVGMTAVASSLKQQLSAASS